MKVITAILLMSLATDVVLAGSIQEWKCNDGIGFKTVKNNVDPTLSGMVKSPQKMKWAQADERGFFMRLDGASVEIPHSDKLVYSDGFILEVEFSVDFEAQGKSEWGGLISKGKNYSAGYAVMLNRNGVILVVIKTDKGEIWFQCRSELKSKRDHKLLVAVGNGNVKIYLDGKLAGQRAYYGKKLLDDGHPLYLGAPYYPFFGNLYHVKLQPYDEALLPKNAPAATAKQKTVFRELPTVDPAGTVILSDFSVFSPKPIIGATVDQRAWCFGTVFKTGPKGTLYSPGIDVAPISCDPGLKGKYDIYVCGRLLSNTTMLQLTLDDDPQAYRIHGKAQEDFDAVHRNYEICVARDVEMDGTRVTLYPGGFYYLGYLKFIPSSNRRAKENPADPDVIIERGAVIKPGPNRKYLAEHAKDFIERRYVETRQAPVPSAASRQRGYQIFSHPWMRLLFPNSVPPSDDGSAALEISAAPGEYEPVTLGVRGLRDAGKVTLALQKPFEKSGITADITVVEAIPKRTTSYHGRSEFMVAPQYLERTDSLEIKADVTRQFWITFHVPSDTPAGIYRGEFTLTGTSGKITVPATVKVYSFNLSDADGTDYFFWSNTSSMQSVAQDFDDMGKHGFNTVSMHSDKGIKMLDYRLDHMNVDLDNSPLTLAYNTLKKFGPVHSIILYDNVFADTARWNPGQELESCKKLLQLIRDYGRTHGWPEIAWLGEDEVLSNPSRIPDCLARMQRHRDAGMLLAINHLWEKTVRPQHQEAAEIAAISEVFILRFNTGNLYYVDTWPEILRIAVAKGKQVYSYNNDCCLVYAQPAGKRFAHGWFFRSFGKGSRGMGWYQYLAFTNSPYTDLDGESSDWCYIYPPSEGRKGGCSIDFEALREGIDDMRYIRTLEKTIEQAKKQGIYVCKAEKLLADLAGSFDWEKFRAKSIFIDSAWENQYEKDGKRYASGDLLTPNGWRLEDYDAARGKLAAAIIELKEQMK